MARGGDEELEGDELVIERGSVLENRDIGEFVSARARESFPELVAALASSSGTDPGTDLGFVPDSDIELILEERELRKLLNSVRDLDPEIRALVGALPRRELSDIERLGAYYHYLRFAKEENAEVIEQMRQELGRGDLDDETTLSLHHLQATLPLLRASAFAGSSSAQTFADILQTNTEGDILGAAARGNPSTARAAALMIQALAASQSDIKVPVLEELVARNFAFAQERSAIGNREVQFHPLALSPDSSWMMGITPPGKILRMLGVREPQVAAFAYADIPGYSGIEPTVVLASAHSGIKATEEGLEIDEFALRRVMVHEMIHDTQAQNTSSADDIPEGWAPVERTALMESLTEGLAVLRMKDQAHPEMSPEYIKAYRPMVYALFSVFEEMSIDPKDYADRLEYLNGLSVRDAEAVMREWSGREDFREVFLGHIGSVKAQNVMAEKSLRLRDLLLRPRKTIAQVREVHEELSQKVIGKIQQAYRDAPPRD